MSDDVVRGLEESLCGHCAPAEFTKRNVRATPTLMYTFILHNRKLFHWEIQLRDNANFKIA